MKPPKEEHVVLDWKNESRLSLSVGDMFLCKFHRHGSVGEDAEFEISDTDIVVHEDTEMKYLHPEKMKRPGWTGGDAESGKWVFKALKPGKTTLIIKILFRFDVESEHPIEIVVD
ncbi:MAG: hypothetical protein ACTSUO_03635 [Candidatus Thorarchaeota archaeon]